MIRPVTCICVLLAAGSGLYLYQTKHRTLMLDNRIATVLRQGDEARARTTALKAEYALLNQPERLSQLSGRYLALRPLLPTQFVQLASLNQHLPPVQVFPSPGAHVDAPATVASPAMPSQAAPSAAATTDDDAEAPPEAPVAPPPAPEKLVAKAAPAIHAATRLADSAPRPAIAHAASDTRSRYAGLSRAQPMPMAALRPVESAVMATAALRPAGTPTRPRLTADTYTPPYRAAYRMPMPSYGAGNGGSALGGSGDTTLAPPVPVAN